MWARHGSLWDPLAYGAPVFVLSQLCPMIEEALEDLHKDLLRLVSSKYTAVSHLFPLLMSRPPGPGAAHRVPPQSGLLVERASADSSLG